MSFDTPENNFPFLIGISGKSGSGKDTVANWFVNTFQATYSEHFADALKEACSAIYRVPLRYFYDSELKEDIIPAWNMSPRQMAQFFGTEIIRANLGDSHWINVLDNKLSGYCANTDVDGVYDKDDTVIIPDVRFDNELKWILNSGGVVIVLHRDSATGNVGIPGHVSESGISEATLHLPGVVHIENNGTLEDLEHELNTFVSTQSLDRLIRRNSFSPR